MPLAVSCLNSMDKTGRESVQVLEPNRNILAYVLFYPGEIELTVVFEDFVSQEGFFHPAFIQDALSQAYQFKQALGEELVNQSS